MLQIAVIALALTVGVSGQTTPPPVDCSSPTGSPQFAILCQIGGILDFWPFVGLSADAVCDADCRCTHGAMVRGGLCGTSPYDSETYCICDFDTSPPRAPLLGLLTYIGCTNIFPLVTNLCQTNQDFFNGACNADCQCSHGYLNTGNHQCIVDSSYSNNNVPYCFCGNHTNL